ncbi:hypothetical protein Tco_1059883 [Tanacetum coccineum]
MLKYITDVIVDHLHQSWRTFASIINKCLCGKEDLDYQTDNKDSKKQDKMFYLRFMKIFIHHFLKKDKSILMRNKTFTHTARDDSLLGTMRLVSRHEDTQVYAEPPKSKKSHKKSDAAILSEVSPSKKKSTSKPQHSKKKAPVKATRGKSLNESSYGTNEGTGTKPGFLDVPKYDSERNKDSWGNSDDEDGDDEEDIDDGDEDDDGNDDDDDDDMNDDDDDDGTESERLESDKIKIPDLNKSSSKEHDDEEEEYDDEFNVEEGENMDEEENDDVIKELYKDANLNLGNKDADMTEAEQGFEQEEEDAHVTLTTVHDMTEGPMQSYSVSSNFTSKLLNLENPSSDVNEIASLMNTTTIPPPPPSINPLQPQATPTPTPTASEMITLFIALPDFFFIFKFNDIVTKLETDMSKMKQVDQYAQAISFIPSIVDRYIDNKLKEVVQQAITSHNVECREEAQAEKKKYIDLIDTLVRAIIKEEVKTQLPRILHKAVSDFATPVIEKNVTKSLEAAVLAKSSSQPKSTYKAAASLLEFELMKILMDKKEENKSHLRVDYKKELYDALVNSYNINKDLFNTYGEVFTLKRGRDDTYKDQNPSAGSDRGKKRRKSSKEAESSKDPRLKESKSSSSSKGTSRSHHKSYGKSAHTEEPSHTVDDSEVRQNQEFDTSNNDEQPDDEVAPKGDWYKKPERPPTPDPDWDKRQRVDFRPPQT